MKRTTPPIKNDKRTIQSWVMFDWANSVYSLVISVAIFPIYFANITPEYISIFGSDIASSSAFSFSVATAYFILLLASPLLSGVADVSGRKLDFMKFFTLLGSLACVGMFFFYDGYDQFWLVGIACYILATIGFAGALVFYNAYLPEIATEDQYDGISARGFSYGYIGSVLLMLICLVVIMKPEWFGISSSTLPSRIAFVLVGLWWIGFAQIPFRRLPKETPVAWTREMLGKGHREILKIWSIVRQRKYMLRYLASFFFYSCGVQTILYMATTFTEKELNFETQELIITILLLQVLAIAGAYIFARVSMKFGNKLSILIMLGIWISLCFAAYIVTDKTTFYFIAGAVGLVMGGIQSQSRSAYAKFIPDDADDTASYFSFFDVIEKSAVVVGTFAFGIVDYFTGNMRFSILTLTFFFLIGIVLVFMVRFGDRPPERKLA